MHATFQHIFDTLSDFEIAITGSVLKDYEAAKDIDILFLASQDFRKLSDELGIPYRGGFEGDGGRVHSLHYLMHGVEKDINLIQRTGVDTFEQWPHAVLLRDGTIFNEGKYHQKSLKGDKAQEISPKDDEFSLPDEHITKCCWCGSPLTLEEDKEDGYTPPAWCSGSEECRQRQRDSGIAETVDGEQRWLFLPTPKQVECMLSKKKNLFIWGNRGGGKSVMIRWLLHAMALTIPNFKYAILRTSFVELEKNHLIYLDQEMSKFGPANKSYYHKTAHICYYPNGSIGFYSQCENDSDVDKILGAELNVLVFDEAPTFKWAHIRLIAGSVRVRKGKRQRPLVRYLGNPVGECIDELWSYCIDKDVNQHVNEDDEDGDPEYDPNDWDAIEIRLEDNPHLDYTEYRKQFAGLPKHIRKAWLDGVRMEERTLFEFYPVKYNEETHEVESYHVIDEMPTLPDGRPVIYYDPDAENDDGTIGRWVHPDWIRIYRGYDHGFYPDPAVMLWFAIVGRMIICFKEMHWYRMIGPDIAKEATEESRGMNIVTTYCDPSIDINDGKSNNVLTTKELMEAAGRSPFDNGKNDRALFADVLHRLLGQEIGPHQPRIVFLRRGCPMLIKYIPRMKWDEHDPAKMAEHKMDHWCVCLAYFAMSQIPITRPEEVRSVKRWMKPKKGKKRYGK